MTGPLAREHLLTRERLLTPDEVLAVWPYGGVTVVAVWPYGGEGE